MARVRATTGTTGNRLMGDFDLTNLKGGKLGGGDTAKVWTPMETEKRKPKIETALLGYWFGTIYDMLAREAHAYGVGIYDAVEVTKIGNRKMLKTARREWRSINSKIYSRQLAKKTREKKDG